MKKKNNQLQELELEPICPPSQQEESVSPSDYKPTARQKATPYYLTYLAAYGQRPVYEEPVEPVVYTPVPKAPKKMKRSFFVAIIAIMSILMIASVALSGLGVIGMFNKEGPEEISLGANDIIKGIMQKLGVEPAEGEESSIFYTDCLEKIDDIESMFTVIGIYLVPIALLVFVVLALGLAIKSLIALFSSKRRKLSYLSLLTLLFSALFLVGGAVWNGRGLLGLVSMFTGEDTNLSFDIGIFLMLGSSLLAWIASWFAYRKDKEGKKEAKLQKAMKKTAKKQANAMKKGAVAYPMA